MPRVSECRNRFPACAGTRCDAAPAVITVRLMALPSVLEELDRLFEELVRRPWGSISRRLVPAEIREVADGWIVELPVEGLRAADLKVDVQGKQLTVTGHRRLHRERRHDKAAWTQTQQEVSLHRTLRLPSGANPDDIEAKLEGSTLTIHLGKRKP